MLTPVDYLAIGHVTYDVLPDGLSAVGGTVSYAALTAKVLHESVGILTSAEASFDFSVFDDVAAVNGSPAAKTTTFRNSYVNGRRHQTVYTVANQLTPDLVPATWTNPAIAHIGPVIEECDPALVTVFPPTTFVGVTSQGWMRARDREGRVHPKHWAAPAAVLDRASAVIFSLDDMQRDWDIAQQMAQVTKILVVTMGPQGGILFIDGQPEPFPALCVTEVDPTGAGDIFAAVFFHAVASGLAPIEGARFAACLASRSVTRPGTRGVPDPEDIALCRS